MGLRGVLRVQLWEVIILWVRIMGVRNISACMCRRVEKSYISVCMCRRVEKKLAS